MTQAPGISRLLSELGFEGLVARRFQGSRGAAELALAGLGVALRSPANPQQCQREFV